MTDNPVKVECPRCEGRGETAVFGTTGPTISPEALETRECYLCKGDCEVLPVVAAEFQEDLAYVASLVSGDVA